jgi:hypothetical protein
VQIGGSEKAGVLRPILGIKPNSGTISTIPWFHSLLPIARRKEAIFATEPGGEPDEDQRF